MNGGKESSTSAQSTNSDVTETIDDVCGAVGGGGVAETGGSGEKSRDLVQLAAVARCRDAVADYRS